MSGEKEYEANCAMSTIVNTTENLKYWIKEKNYDEIAHLLKSMERGVIEMHSMLAIPSEPNLIQGYTAEQRQEIIDGGYLCEFKNESGRWTQGLLASCSSDGDNYYFIQENVGSRKFCRPAQIKGVLRPIFVEPEIKNSHFHFFDPVGDRISYGSWPENQKEIERATKYIEV